jgi:hypothetical protein
MIYPWQQQYVFDLSSEKKNSFIVEKMCFDHQNF